MHRKRWETSFMLSCPIRATKWNRKVGAMVGTNIFGINLSHFPFGLFLQRSVVHWRVSKRPVKFTVPCPARWRRKTRMWRRNRRWSTGIVTTRVCNGPSQLIDWLRCFNIYADFVLWLIDWLLDWLFATSADWLLDWFDRFTFMIWFFNDFAWDLLLFPWKNVSLSWYSRIADLVSRIQMNCPLAGSPWSVITDLPFNAIT